MDPTPQLNILILDDETDMTFLLSTVLEFHQFQVTVSNVPADALVHLKKEKFDVLITDYVMEGMSGMEVIRKVRHEMGLGELKIILLTFKDLEAKELEVMAKDNVHYLKKPFLPNELVMKIESVFAE